MRFHDSLSISSCGDRIYLPKGQVCNRTTASFVFYGEDIFEVFVKMNSKYLSRISRTATITLAAALALVTMTGCFGSPRANDTVAGAAIGAGTGALIGGSEGSPGTGALIGGLGGGAVGYIVGTETEHYNASRGYGPDGYYGGY
jgi:hypothetical protein